MSYTKTIVVGFILFGLVILTALSTFYASLGKCIAEVSVTGKLFSSLLTSLITSK